MNFKAKITLKGITIHFKLTQINILHKEGDFYEEKILIPIHLHIDINKQCWF